VKDQRSIRGEIAMQEADYVSPKDFWSKFGIAASTTYRWIREGRIRAIRLGKRFVIPRAEIDRIEKEGLADANPLHDLSNSTET
jgi:excisionase family DNA binding protein